MASQEVGASLCPRNFKAFCVEKASHLKWKSYWKVTLPLAGMCSDGSSVSLGGVNFTLLSVFWILSFLCALGEELDELLELVTVSPELYEGEEKF